MEKGIAVVEIDARSTTGISEECVEVKSKDTWPPTEAEIEEFLEAIRRSRHLPCCEFALKK